MLSALVILVDNPPTYKGSYFFKLSKYIIVIISFEFTKLTILLFTLLLFIYFPLFTIIYFTISEKVMAPHSSTLAWKTPWTEEPGRLFPWSWKKSDTTERLHFHFSLSCIRERNGNPLQYSCLENPRDGGTWWGPTESHRVGHD